MSVNIKLLVNTINRLQVYDYNNTKRIEGDRNNESYTYKFVLSSPFFLVDSKVGKYNTLDQYNLPVVNIVIPEIVGLKNNKEIKLVHQKIYSDNTVKKSCRYFPIESILAIVRSDGVTVNLRQYK